MGDREDRQRKIEERWEDRAYNAADRPIWTAFKVFLGIIAVIAVITVIGGFAGFWFSWFNEGKRIVGPENSREQTTSVLDDEKGMEATAGNVCEIDKEGVKTQSNDPQIVGGSPRFQYAARYRDLKRDYDRRMANLFEGAVTRQLPLPDALGGLPKQAPTLEVRMREVC